MEGKVYTLEEAATLTRLSRDAIREAVRAGRLKAIKPGKRWLILKEPLDRLLSGETTISA